MAVFNAYFDDSASGDRRVLSVGGFIATREAWNTLFNPSWQRFLDRHGLEYFRMSEYESPHRKPYGDWSSGQKIRELQELHSIIRRTANVAVSASVVMDDFEAVRDDLAATFGGLNDPFHYCAHFCIGWASRWRRDHLTDIPLAFVFENGSEGEGELKYVLEVVEVMRRMDLVDDEPFSFAPKRTPELQAGDMIAYETMKSTQAKMGYESRPERKSLLNLLAPPMRWTGGLLDRAYFREIIDSALARRSKSGLGRGA